MSQPQLEEDGLAQFSLEPPKPIGEIKAEKIQQVMDSQAKKDTYQSVTQTITPEMKSALDKQVEELAAQILSADSDSQEFKDLANTLNSLGNKEIRKTSNLSERMLTRGSLKSLKENDHAGVGNEQIANELIKLRQQVVQLDPNSRKTLSKRGLMRLLPFGAGKKIENYAQQYKSAKTVLDEIVTALYQGKDTLIEDNAHIDEDKSHMQKLMKDIEQYAYIIQKFDEKVEERLPEIEAVDRVKAENVRQEILFPIRKKRIDLLQHLAVSMQGYMALQVIRSNNDELIRGVDNATTTTMAALRTAITISEALNAQKQVIDAVNNVNELSSNLLLSSSEALNKQGTEIHKQASNSAISVEKLDKAFVNVFAALDAMDTYRSQALPNMKKTIDSLENTVNKAKGYMSVERKAAVADIAKEVFTSEEPDTTGPSGVVNVVKPKRNKV